VPDTKPKDINLPASSEETSAQYHKLIYGPNKNNYQLWSCLFWVNLGVKFYVYWDWFPEAQDWPVEPIQLSLKLLKNLLFISHPPAERN